MKTIGVKKLKIFDNAYILTNGGLTRTTDSKKYKVIFIQLLFF
tara:strand:- start:421 stop:549 length:129 start_codon:yes stop_codon:yes gene_type:complete